MISYKAPAKRKSGWIAWTIILALVLFAIAGASVYVVRYSIAQGVSAAKDSFLSSYNAAKDETYNQYHDVAFHYSEAEHHVSNDVTISISTVKEKSALEVLRVSDVVYIISDSEETKSGTTAWLKVPGTGVFTVNLTAAEYVVDNDRHTVLVRVPQPELDSKNIAIDLDRIEILHFSENVWSIDNSIRSGEELIRNQLSEAMQRIQEDFEVNEQYSKLAEASAEAMIVALIKGINPDIENLEVRVEFYRNRNLGF